VQVVVEEARKEEGVKKLRDIDPLLYIRMKLKTRSNGPQMVISILRDGYVRWFEPYIESSPPPV